MTVVNADTGEIVQPLTYDEALAVTEAIRVLADNLFELIVKAYHGRVWEVLDYKSWDEYRATEFGYAPLALPREERPEMVASLRESGLSLRAIASVTGVSQEQARRDLESPVTNVTPATVTGTDGKVYPSLRAVSPPPTEEQQRESRLRAARTNLQGVLIYLTSQSITPEALANQEYAEVIGEFDLEQVRYAAETLRHLIQIGENL